MEIFSQQDYYPSPSPSVILYSDQPVTKARRAVSQADIYALIVYLSSPVDPVSYPIFSDFFLVYREFISPINLYDLLIKRFEWCIAEINCGEIDRIRIGNIALVRTFVFVRHGLLNHFIEDFLNDYPLRLMFIDFLNKDYSKEPSNIVKDCVVNLKKVWIHAMKSTWDNLKFDEPGNVNHSAHSNNNPSTPDQKPWLVFKIRDIDQIDTETKRASRLSLTAIQSISSPDFRNQSVMSLYKNHDNFQLSMKDKLKNNNDPKNQSRRTPSMLLNPDNNFNYASQVLINKEQDKATFTDDKEPFTETPNLENNEEEGSHKPLRRKVSIISKLPPNMSPTITDLEYPRHSRIDKIIPPTPAKKIELILNTTYIPEEEASSIPRPNSNKTSKTIEGRERSNIPSPSSSQNSNYIGPMGLLNKWKGNHSRNKRHGNSVSFRHEASFHNNENNTQLGRIVKPQMDTFVKYVISISSLDNHNIGSNDAINLDDSKFDILSARTIDEVEFLLNLENTLLEKVNNLGNGNTTVSTQTTVDNNDNNSGNSNHDNNHDSFFNKNENLPEPVNNFSAMDNLDLYQTVSSIAQSVISLSNTLNMTNNNNNGDLTLPFDSRRKVKSSTAAFFGQPNNSSKFLLENQNFNNGQLLNSPTYVDGPQRLVFHDSSNDNPTRPLSSYSNLTNSTPTKTNNSPIKKRGSSPLKKMLEDLQEVDFKEEHQGIFVPSKSSTNKQISNDADAEYISYDSDISDHVIKSDPMHGPVPTNSNNSLDKQPDLKKKDSFINLREFTFEDSNKGGNETEINNKNIPVLEHPNIPVNDSLDVITDLYGTLSTGTEDNDVSTSISVNTEGYDDMSSLHNVESQINLKNNDREYISTSAIRPASGRISLINRRTTQLTKRKTQGTLSPVSVDIGNTDFYAKDKILQENEKKLTKLEENLAQRESGTPSIATTTLFTSRHNSPRKIKTASVKIDELSSSNPRIRLSIQPSIQSIVSDGSFSSYSTFESNPNKRISLRSKFQEGLVANNAGQFETSSTNKYIFEPDTESLDGASPEKDMEELKNKFLKKDDIKTPSKVENTAPIEDPPLSKNISQKIDEEALKNIADITDDTIQDDPLRVAMMKLEGTYIKAKHPLVTESSPNVSKISKEVKMLNISTVLSIPNTPQEKRKSLLIQRRRQTLMNIPYTPPLLKTEQSDIGKGLQYQIDDQLRASDIEKLLSGYEIHDPNLLISNNEHHIPFILTYDSLSIARQMTLIEKELLSEIDWKDLLDLKIQYDGPAVTSWLQLLVQNESLSGVDLAIARFNLTVDWIISEIAITKDVKIRRNTIQRFIHIAEHCRKFQNYNTLMQIVLALNSIVVQKFIDAWRLIEPGDLLTWEELKKIPSLDRNYHTIRDLLNHIDPLKGCVPFIVVYLSDLSFNAEKRTWIEEDKIINYNKFDTSVQIVKHFIQRVQWCKHYTFEVDHELLSKCIYLTALPEIEVQQLAS